MALGETTKSGLDRSSGSVRVVASGSVKSDWVLCNSDLTTDNSAALLDLTDSGDHTNAKAMIVPAGATRCQFRHAYSTDAINFTNPVVAIVGVDSNDVPFRIDDEDDSNGTGITFTGASSGVFEANSRLWGEVTGEYDLRGASIVYALVDTAANYTDGSTAVDNVELWVRFLN